MLKTVNKTRCKTVYRLVDYHAALGESARVDGECEVEPPLVVALDVTPVYETLGGLDDASAYRFTDKKLS